MARPNHNVHPTSVAPLPPLHQPLHQHNPIKKPTPIRLQEQPLRLTATVRINSRRQSPITYFPATTHHYHYFDFVDEGG